MTYYEWVDTLKKIEVSPMDYNILDNLKDKLLGGEQYVYGRFISHVINTIVTRLDNAYKNLLNRITIDIDLDSLSLEMINYKKELKFIDKIIDISVINNEDKVTMRTNIDKTIADIYDILRSNIEFIDSDGQYISTFEKIMNTEE